MTPDELEKLEAVIDAGEYTGSVKDLINLTQNLDCFEFYPEVKDEEDLGRMYLLELDALQIPEYLVDYIDYEAYETDTQTDRRTAYTVPDRPCGCPAVPVLLVLLPPDSGLGHHGSAGRGPVLHQLPGGRRHLSVITGLDSLNLSLRQFIIS